MSAAPRPDDEGPLLSQVARVIRSKNAGPFEITFDVMFEDQATYEAIRDSQAITQAGISELFGIDQDDFVYFGFYDPAYALKFTIRRELGSGGPRERDTYGCQQHGPLIELRLPRGILRPGTATN